VARPVVVGFLNPKINLTLIRYNPVLIQGMTWSLYMLIRCLIFLIVVTFAINLKAGDITGAPAVLPPQVLGDFSFLWSNDFYGSGGESDDYRTQQLGFQINLKSKWGLIFDHSILTAGKNNPVLPGTSGRLDQVSLSFMYDIYRHGADGNQFSNIKAGAGFRAYGNYGGSRMQNSFHRIVNSSTHLYPYVDTKSSTAIVWLKGDYQKLYPLQSADSLETAWQAGYWVDATTLLSADGQWDATLSANAVVRNQTMTLWLGLREDRRENYDADFVQTATAQSESGTSFTFGVGIGPIVFETVQGLDNKASFGRLLFTSVENEYMSPEHSLDNKNAVSFNLLLPDVVLEAQYRRALAYRLKSFGAPRTWVLFGVHYGQPAYQDSFYVHKLTRQAAIGLELEWHNNKSRQWAWPYLALSAGQRTEQLRADSGTLAGQESEQVSSPVIEAGTGIRFNLYPGRTWQLLFQAGLVGHYPTSSKTVVFDQQDVELLQPDLAASLGLSVTFGL